MRLRNLLRRAGADRELEEELSYHLDREIEQNLAAGMPPRDARTAALRSLGGIAQLEEECRDARGTRWLEILFHELRYGVRMMRRTPGFSAACVLTIAIAMAASTSIFSLVYGVLLQPLPYRDPDRLVAIWTAAPRFSLPRAYVGAANYLDWRSQSRTLEDIALVRHIANYNLTGDGEPERLVGARLSANLFKILGVKPSIGRAFTQENERAGRRMSCCSATVVAAAFRGRSGSGRAHHPPERPTVYGPGRNAAELPVPGQRIRTLGASVHPTRRSAGPFRFQLPRRRKTQARRDACPGSVGSRHDLRATRRGLPGERGHPRGCGAIAGRHCRDGADRSVRTARRGRLPAAHWRRERGEPVPGAGSGSHPRPRATVRTRSFRGTPRRTGNPRGPPHRHRRSGLRPGGGRMVTPTALHLLPASTPRLDEVRIGAPVLVFSGALLLVTAAMVAFWPALQAARTRIGAELRVGDRSNSAKAGVREFLAVGRDRAHRRSRCRFVPACPQLRGGARR